MTMRGRSIFLDTNILLSASDRDRPDFSTCRNIFSNAIEGGYHLYISPQIIREYLVVATRPVDVNGLGLSLKDALHNIDQFRRRTVIAGETEEVLEQLLNLVASYSVSGKRIHDANIIAFMTEHNISCLITLNIDDFKGFSGMETCTPQDFLLKAGV